MNNSRKLFKSKFDLIALLVVLGVPMLGLWMFCGLTNFRSNFILFMTIFLNGFFWLGTYFASRLTKYGTKSRFIFDLVIAMSTGIGVIWMLGLSILEKPLQILIFMICGVAAFIASEFMTNLEPNQSWNLSSVKKVPFWLFAVVFTAGFSLMGSFWFSG